MGGTPSQQTKQTTNTVLPTQQAANVNMLMQGARDQYLSGGPQYFPGQTYAGTTPEEIAARDRARAYAGGVGGAFVDTARRGDEFWLNPANVFNPGNIPGFRESQAGVTNQITQNLTRNILPSIRQGSIAEGGLGGSRQGIGEGLAIGETSRGIGDTLANMEMGAYGMGQNMYNAAAARAPGMYNLGLAPSDTLNQIGAAGRADTQQKIDADISKFNFEQLAPLLNLQALQSLTGTAGQYGGTNTSTGTQTQTGGSNALPVIGSLITLMSMLPFPS